MATRDIFSRRYTDHADREFFLFFYASRSRRSRLSPASCIHGCKEFYVIYQITFLLFCHSSNKPFIVLIPTFRSFLPHLFTFIRELNPLSNVCVLIAIVPLFSSSSYLTILSYSSPRVEIHNARRRD